MSNNTGENRLVLEEPVQYLTFRLDGEYFATEITQVREILEFCRITKVPRTPDYMRGVINLRGSVVPVLDLRCKFGMEEVEPTVDTCIVIVEVRIDNENTVLGALADSVQEVIELNSDQLEPVPRLGTRVNAEFISAIGKQDDKFVMILDMNRIFTEDLLMELEENSPRTEMQDVEPAGEKNSPRTEVQDAEPTA